MKNKLLYLIKLLLRKKVKRRKLFLELLNSRTNNTSLGYFLMKQKCERFINKWEIKSEQK